MRELTVLEKWASAVASGELSLSAATTRLCDSHESTPGTKTSVATGRRSLAELGIEDALWQSADELGAVNRHLDEVKSLFNPLPAIEAVMCQAEMPGKADSGEGTLILCCRHLLASTVLELEAIRALLPRATFAPILGKTYSASRPVVYELERRGFKVVRQSAFMDEPEDVRLGDFNGRQRRLARNLVRDCAVVQGRYERILVIDDGGVLINAVGAAVLRGDLQGAVCGVEQTTHGTFAVRSLVVEPRMKDKGLVVVSVADSWAKLNYESPMIATSIYQSLGLWLNLPGLALQPRSSYGLIGYGTVGAWIASAAGQNSVANLAVYDLNRHKLSLARANKIKTENTLSALLADAEIIIAATGGTSLKSNDVALLRDNALLVSASSSDREFRALSHEEIVRTKVHKDVSVAFDRVHSLLQAREGGRVVNILNSGFPCNFTGEIEPIPAHQIQLTRALVVAGVMQLLRISSRNLKGSADIVELDDHAQELVLRHMNAA